MDPTAITAMFKSYKSSVAGFVTGVVYYLYTTGAQLPQTKQDFWHLAIGACFTGFGLVVKDADKIGK